MGVHPLVFAVEWRFFSRGGTFLACPPCSDRVESVSSPQAAAVATACFACTEISSCDRSSNFLAPEHAGVVFCGCGVTSRRQTDAKSKQSRKHQRIHPFSYDQRFAQLELFRTHNILDLAVI